MTAHTTEFTMWLILIGSGGAILFPDLVTVDAMFANHFVDSKVVRMVAIPLFIVTAAILTDFHLNWSTGLLR